MKMRGGGWRRMGKEEKAEKPEVVDDRPKEEPTLSLLSSMDDRCDAVTSLCQRVWSTVGGRLGREDMIALLNALRVPHSEVKRAVDRKFRDDPTMRLAFDDFFNFMKDIVNDDTLADTKKRVQLLYDKSDFVAPVTRPSMLRMLFYCIFSPIFWPIFAFSPNRRASMMFALHPPIAVAIWIALTVSYVPIALMYPYRGAMKADRVSALECFLPALFMIFMCMLKASSIGVGWFHWSLSSLHKWRKLRAQERFLQRLERNRILMQKLQVAIYGVITDPPRSVWAYELVVYIEQAYALPNRQTHDALARGSAGPKPLSGGTSSGTLWALVGPSSGRFRRRAEVGPDVLLRDEPATNKDAWYMKIENDEYYEYDLPDALDKVTHSMAIGQHALFSFLWFRERLRRPIVPLLVVLAVLSLAIPCMVRQFIHGIPYYGAHPASRFVVLLNSIYAVPSVLVVLLTLHHFLDMLQFRKLLLRGLTATVRSELASDCGVRVLLNLREPVNLKTWSHLISYLRRRNLSEEVVPFNTLLLPALLLDVALCLMFIWEWIEFHVEEDPEYTVNALDIISGVTVVWLSTYIIMAMSRACDINIALESHAEVLEGTQVDIREAISELGRPGETTGSSWYGSEDKELRSLRTADEILTAIVRKTRNVDINKPFKLLGVSITTSRLRAVAGILIGGMLSGLWRQVDDVLFMSFGIEF